ncbi:hypothetical protein BT93_C1169 [Corymbia citriodora subsp. variegata]|nr:hypothetical protein BT93_C1169 [Corymbia citriodora subsp. variegata]
MLEYLWVSCMVAVAAIALYAVLLKEFLKESVGQTAVEGSADNDSATEKGTVESDACTSASPRVNETAQSSGCDYEVFLNFRGPDTRAGFTDFLYTSFIDVGIRTFKDDEELRIGEEFSSELLQAINQSKISIPIFSKDYASSAWCLKELVQMVECQKTKEQKIMPIFYDVAPSEVRHQTGSYGKAFLSHENNKRYDKKTVREWKTALKKVSFLNGCNLHDMPNRREGQFARKLTQEIFTELKKAYLVVSDYLVGVDNHVDAIMEKIGAQMRETRIIGIHGMGGIGKTTIAKIIYNRLSHDFKNCCFLPDIRETSKVKGILYLQNQLISDVFKMKCINIRHIDEGTQIIKDKLSNKRVLLLLDDVEKYNHMCALVGKGDWLGEGSKIIITTRNKDVLDVLEVYWSYEVSTMDPDQSLKLFSKHAFKRDYPLDEYIVQSKKAIKIAGGLPLALEVMGSLLFCKNKEMWDAILEKLANAPHVDVQGKLKISYDELDEGEKEIFLDIACLFIGYDKDILIYFWDQPKLFPKVAMEVLQSLSLIKIKENNKVWMHDQIRDFGRMLVSEKKIEKQTRVWNPEEALNLLWRHEGNTEAKALRLNFDGEQQCHFAYKDFKRLSNLRFLEVNDSMENFCAEERLFWHESPSNVFPTNENSNLLPRLRWLSWHKIPPAFDITNFSMKDVVILNLSKSKITDDWMGWSHITVMKNLKVLDMSSCDNLRRIPIFFSHPNLERLILHGCQSLITIGRSIFQLKRLLFLDVSNCYNLWKLPDKLGKGLANLKYLSLRWCTSLERLPHSIGNLESLIELNISNTSINELPDSIGNLKELKVVKAWTSKLNKMPDVLWSMGNLEEIVASRVHNACGKHFHVDIGNGIYGSQSLKTLILKSAHIYALPTLPESLVELRLSELHTDAIPDLSNLTNLKDMDLGFSWPHRDGISNGLGEHPMPQWIGNLSKPETLDLHSHRVTTSPTDLTLPPRLNSLRLRHSNLHHLRRLPSTLSSLYLEDCKSLCSMEDLSNLKKLSSLFMSGATIAEIQGLGCLENLQELHLSWLGQVEILPDLSNLNKLRMLQKLPDLSSLVAKQVVFFFVLRNCKKLNVETILDVARLNPQHFRFVNFEQLRILPDLSNSTELRHLEVERCDNLVEIQGELPQSLEVLKINSCKSLWKLPNLSSLTRLRKVRIDHYYDLVDIQEVALFVELGEATRGSHRRL